MRDDALTLLCTGDIHLGRHPTRIPSDLDGAQYSPKTLWHQTVDHAINQRVDAVIVTGDVVDRDNRYFEAYGAFETGATRLNQANIPLILVAGNHDYDTLPRLANDLDLEHLHLLGENGSWERWTLQHNEQDLIHFDGWSFPSQHVLTSPLPDYDLAPDPDTPTLGLLHADLDTPESEYAPVPKQALLTTPADAWLLGHIHKPHQPHETDPLILYPGSPQPLDPGEQGPHGPWRIDITPSGRIDPQHLPLATLRYDRLELDATGAHDPKAILPLISEGLTQHINTQVATGDLDLFLPRITLTGRCPAHAALQEEHATLKDQLEFKIDTVPVHVETLDLDTRPDIDLEELAGDNTPAAWLAQLLLDLEDGAGQESEAVSPVVEDALDAMQTAYNANTYNALRREGWRERPDEDQARDELQRQARSLLDTLVAQKEADAP